MKKSILKIMCLAFAICCILSLAACGGNSGKYTLNGAKMGDMTITADMLGASAEDCYLEIDASGNAKFSLNGEVTDMKYADGKIWPASEGVENAVSFVIDGNTIYMEQDGIQMIFKK